MLLAFGETMVFGMSTLASGGTPLIGRFCCKNVHVIIVTHCIHVIVQHPTCPLLCIALVCFVLGSALVVNK